MRLPFYYNYKFIVQTCFTCLILLFIVNNRGYSQCSTSDSISEVIANKINGQVDFTVIGNTQNTLENNSLSQANCNQIAPNLTTSDVLTIPDGDTVLKAHLYWSGTGSHISTVQLNGQSISSQRCWTAQRAQASFFSSYADVTDFVKQTGSGTYELTGLDNSQVYESVRCESSTLRSTLYGGWALVVVFENKNKYDNFTIYFYDGFRVFQNDSFDVQIFTNVYEKYEGAHVGVLSWEGDKDNSISGDDIRVNGQLLPSEGYTDPKNIFNGTNSFNKPVNNELYNCDFDDFDASEVVRQKLNTEGADFNFQLASGQDLIILNSIIFRLPNRAPDAVIQMPDLIDFGCTVTDRTKTFTYTYKNLENASKELVAGLPVFFRLNSPTGEIIGQDVTSQELQPGESATATATITLPDGILGKFEVYAHIDDPTAEGSKKYGKVLELIEENNTSKSDGKIDKEYINLILEKDICEGDVIDVAGVPVDKAGVYPFDLKTSVSGCDSIGTIQIYVRPLFNDEPIDASICVGESFTLPDGTVVNPEPKTTPYSYSTKLKSIYGCDSIANTRLIVNNISTFSQNIEACFGDVVTLPNGEQTTISDTFETTLTGAASTGCDSIVTTKVTFLDFHYPNAFSPNSDGVNDTFKALFPKTCTIVARDYVLKVYNRWGEVVFETTNIQEPWNGTFNNDKSQFGLYVWQATYTDALGNPRVKNGGVSLVR